MLRLIKVTEDSLVPDYQSGDFVVISKIPVLFGSLKAGDVVVFVHPPQGLLIKRIERVEANGNQYIVLGNHIHSIDSRDFGPIDRRDILGKVIYHTRKS